MPEEHNVSIIRWPEEAAHVEHRFDLEKPCPVAIHFTDEPARVEVSTGKSGRLDVNMDMKVAVPNTIPVCIRMCEPICAESDYTVGISVFDHPVVSISVRGTTRFFNCREKSA